MKIIVFGASGGVGRHVVKEALARGWEVTAFVRDSKGNAPEARLNFVKGDAADAASVESALKGHDAVVSVLGHAKGSPPDVLSKAVGHMVAAMQKHQVRRLVVLSGAAATLPTDGHRSAGHRMLLGAMNVLVSSVAHDMQAMVDTVARSNLDWVIARPMRMTDGEKTERVTAAPFIDLGMGDPISRADVAAFLVNQVQSDAFLKQAPMINEARK